MKIDEPTEMLLNGCNLSNVYDTADSTEKSFKKFISSVYVLTIEKEFFETFVMPRHNVVLQGLYITAEMYLFFWLFHYISLHRHFTYQYHMEKNTELTPISVNVQFEAVIFRQELRASKTMGLKHICIKRWLPLRAYDLHCTFKSQHNIPIILLKGCSIGENKDKLISQNQKSP